MALLERLDKNITIKEFDEIQTFLKSHGIQLEKWITDIELANSSTQDEILGAYAHELKPFMKANGFQSSDVINVHSKMENIEVIRQKFLKEHIHTEDEVRFFVDGEGKFFFNLGEEVVSLLCSKGDFLSVPAGYKHWFDLAPKYSVKAIRIFTNVEGWVAVYTDSEIEKKYVRNK